MKSIQFTFSLLMVLVANIVAAQTSNKYTRLPGGVSYHIAYDATGDAKPEVGDFVETNMYLFVDSNMIYNSLVSNDAKPISFVITESPSKTDIQEAIKHITPGDSVLIRMSVDSMIKAGSPQLDWMKPETGQHATYVVKLLTLRRKKDLNK